MVVQSENVSEKRNGLKFELLFAKHQITSGPGLKQITFCLKRKPDTG